MNLIISEVDMKQAKLKLSYLLLLITIFFPQFAHASVSDLAVFWPLLYVVTVMPLQLIYAYPVSFLVKQVFKNSIQEEEVKNLHKMQGITFVIAITSIIAACFSTLAFFYSFINSIPANLFIYVVIVVTARGLLFSKYTKIEDGRAIPVSMAVTSIVIEVAGIILFYMVLR